MKNNPDEITLNYLLHSCNINKEIYDCDIKRFFGWDLSRTKIIQLKKFLSKVKNEKDKNERDKNEI